MITVIALKAFSDGTLSMHKGEIRDIDENIAASYIAEGYVVEYAESSLPDVTEDDNGKVLAVVNGAWDKAEASGGGVPPIAIMTTSQNGALTLAQFTDLAGERIDRALVTSCKYIVVSLDENIKATVWEAQKDGNGYLQLDRLNVDANGALVHFKLVVGDYGKVTATTKSTTLTWTNY